jgi:hypothetical protein
VKRSELGKLGRSKRRGREAATLVQPSDRSAKNAAVTVRKRLPAGRPQDDATYWESRAERMTRQAARHQDQAVREHFMKIAAGYEALAGWARSVQRDPK